MPIRSLLRAQVANRVHRMSESAGEVARLAAADPQTRKRTSGLCGYGSLGRPHIPRTGSVSGVKTEPERISISWVPPGPTQASGRDSRLRPTPLSVFRRLRLWTLQEPQIERHEYQDDSDVYYQPCPEMVPEE